MLTAFVESRIKALCRNEFGKHVERDAPDTGCWSSYRWVRDWIRSTMGLVWMAGNPWRRHASTPRSLWMIIPAWCWNHWLAVCELEVNWKQVGVHCKPDMNFRMVSIAYLLFRRTPMYSEFLGHPEFLLITPITIILELLLLVRLNF